MLIEAVNYLIAVVFCICYAYQFVYLAAPFFIKRKKPGCDPKLHRFAVLICARNEENVVGQLIMSLKNQSYPADLIHIFVCADNCTDHTAERVEELGATVYIRNDRKKVGKGYALNFLLGKIDADFDLKNFDAFMVFDADNILDENYVREMNAAFSEGHGVVTGYRNSKNYGENWISAGYSLWFLRESQYLNRPRFLLGTSCAVSGTGFLFSREVLERAGGWKYFLLTEDIEFTIDRVIDGEKIAYCETAVLYDEQPTEFKQSVAQRLRWAKGYLQVFSGYGGRLVRGIFSPKFMSCFDMTMNIMPAMILSLLSVIMNLTALLMNLGNAEIVGSILMSFGQSILNIYLTFLGIGALTLATEWRKICASARKKVGYLFLFPVFMFSYIPISIAALFVNVEWKPVRHNPVKSIGKGCAE